MSARAIALAALVALAVVALAVVACTPDADAQRLAIGSACNTSGQCGTGKFFCDTSHVNGYCKAQCTSDANCPAGSICVNAACEKSCAADSDCRAGDLCQSPGFCDQPPVVDLGGSD